MMTFFAFGFGTGVGGTGLFGSFFFNPPFFGERELVFFLSPPPVELSFDVSAGARRVKPLRCWVV